jgi:hypothetical protein
MALTIGIPLGIKKRFLFLHLLHTQSPKGNKVFKLCDKTTQFFVGLHC